MTLDTTIPNDHALASTHRAIWALGDYALMAEEVMAPLGPVLVAATGLGPGVRVLDVAAGAGNISLPAAKSGAAVMSTDLTPELLQRSQAIAAAQGLTLDYREANAHALPFGDSTFDAVISAIDAAIGTSIWITLDVAPAMNTDARNSQPDRASDASPRNIAQQASVQTIRRRFSRRSHSGTSNSRPAA